MRPFRLSLKTRFLMENLLRSNLNRFFCESVRDITDIIVCYTDFSIEMWHSSDSLPAGYCACW